MSATLKPVDEEVTHQMLEAIMAAFNRNDTDAILAWFAHESRFDTTAGPDQDGKSFYGKAEIRAAFDGLFGSVQAIRWDPIDTRIAGDKAYCELRRQATLPSGETQDWLGIDVLTFADGLIIRKSSYGKQRLPSR